THAQRASRYTSGGYASDADAKTWPRLKYHSETENDSSIRRSRFRHEIGRRKFASPSRNAPHRPNQIELLLIFLPPNTEPPPRAIGHATCGPTSASVTIASLSSIRPFASSPAGAQSTRMSQHPPTVPNVQRVGSGWYVAVVTNRLPR